MALVLTEEQTMLRDSARSFMVNNGPVAQLRKLRDSRDADGFSRPLWSQFAEMGFTGVLVAEAHGGLGLGHVEAGVVMEEIGRNLTASPFLASGIVAAMALAHGGSEAQRAAFLPALAAGERVMTLAVDEHSKHQPQNIATSAVRSSNGFVLRGSKTFVVDGHVADTFIVAARTSGETNSQSGITLFLVNRDAAGVAVERVVAVDAHNMARLELTDVAVAADAVIGGVDTGWATLQAALDGGRVATSAELLGIAEETFARTIAYLKERKQFDRVIGEFQGLQHRAAMLYCDIELTRSIVIKAQQSLDANADNAHALVAIAKAHAGKTATRAVQEGVQMHGGMGMTDEFEMGFFMKRARVLQELFGDSNYHMNQYALIKKY